MASSPIKMLVWLDRQLLPHRRVVVSNVNVNGVLRIGSHHADDERVGGVKDVGNQSATIASRNVVLVEIHAVQHAARIARIEANRHFGALSGLLVHTDCFIVVAKQAHVEVGTVPQEGKKQIVNEPSTANPDLLAHTWECMSVS